MPKTLKEKEEILEKSEIRIREMKGWSNKRLHAWLLRYFMKFYLDYGTDKATARKLSLRHLEDINSLSTFLQQSEGHRKAGTFIQSLISTIVFYTEMKDDISPLELGFLTLANAETLKEPVNYIS